MSDVRLSYLIATKNKLPYLRVGIGKLIANKKEDEEILVADGGSSDGTPQYLAELKKAGMIDYFISEPDSGEAHAQNKLLFAAKGTLITSINDDDVFHFKTIAAIKDFMLDHPEIDMTGADGGFKDQSAGKTVRPFYYEESYRKWQSDHTPFESCGLGLVYRRSSLPLLGLWNTSYKRLDAEFMLRNTSGKANIAWYTGHAYVNISVPQSTSLVYMKTIKKETEVLHKLYFDKDPDPFVLQKIRILLNKIRNGTLFKGKDASRKTGAPWAELVAIAEAWLEKINREKKLEFIWNKK